ncbi:MAG: sigma factor [Rubricoccaceae bacterium]|nr:sigma factor [Rubricoccaceae bacterium]
MNPSNRMYRPDDALWDRALDGDRDAFEEAIAPLHDDLLQFARRQVRLQRRLGQLRPSELTPEELMGDGLVVAFERRDRFDPEQMRFRAWLLGLQHRALVRTLRREARYAARKAVSLNEEVPQNESQDAVQEALYEFRMPYDVTTYEELIAGSAPADVEIEFDDQGHAPSRLTEEERAFIEREDVDLSTDARQVILFHDEFALSLPEVAQILDYSLKDTAQALNLARTSLRAYAGSVEDLTEDGDGIDSYTGEPIERNPAVGRGPDEG